MPKQVAHYKCMVISPSDVDDARDAVVASLLDWNAHAGEGLGVKIEAVRWESHARPELGAAPQDIINKQLVDDCDFGIAVFWTRLGSATGKHASGSVEEVERLLAKGANVMVYFCDAPIPQTAQRGRSNRRHGGQAGDPARRQDHSRRVRRRMRRQEHRGRGPRSSGTPRGRRVRPTLGRRQTARTRGGGSPSTRPRPA